MAVDGVDALHILRYHVAVGVHAEGAHRVAVLLGAVDQLGLVHHVGDVLEHGGGQLHPDADVHLIVDELQPQLLALVGEPLRAAPARPGDEVGGGEPLTVLGDEDIAAVGIRFDVLHGGVEQEGVLVPDGLVNVGEDLQVVLGAQMLAPGLKKVEVVLQRPLLQRLGLGGGGGVHLGGGAVPDVQAVHVVDEVHDLPLVQKVGEPAAEGGGEVIFAIGERARAAEAAHGVAHLAVDAALHPARHDGAAPVINVRSLIHHQHLGAGALETQLIGGENSGFAGAEDHDVITGVHCAHLPFYIVWPFRPMVVYQQCPPISRENPLTSPAPASRRCSSGPECPASRCPPAPWRWPRTGSAPPRGRSR